MRSIWMKLSLALALLLGVVSLASAAGFDCTKASNSVERAICGDAQLSALDSQVADAYAKARQRATGDDAEKLQRDQRNWLIERNAMLSQHYNDANTQKNWINDIARLYQERIDFLSYLFQKPSQDALLLEAMTARLPSAAKADFQTFWKSIGGDGSVFEVASEHKMIAADVAKEMPVNDATGLAQLLGDLDQGSFVNVALLPSGKLGGLYSMGGTLHCQTWSLFTWDDHSLHSVKTPGSLDKNCWDTDGTLASFQGKVYAVQRTLDLMSVEIVVQTDVGDSWSQPHRLLARYDYSLDSPESYCESANKDCGALAELAYGYIKRYDRTQYPDALNGALSTQEKTAYEAMLKQTAADGGGQLGDRGPLCEFPTFGHTLTKGYPGFADGSIWFPVHWHGELMLGGIGHDGLGWRIGDNWYVGIWSWDGKALTPVIGVAVSRQRSDYLLSEIL